MNVPNYRLLLRPATVERTSCCSGTYVLLQWDVYPAVVGRNNPANKKPWTTDKKPLAL